MQHHLVIMARAPVMGRVKSRLAADIGVVAATAFYRKELARLVRAVGRDTRWRTWLAVTPDSSLTEPVWPAPLPGMAQGPGDLGDRMGRVMRSMPPGPVVITGCDIPGLGARHVASAFSALGDADAVFGPSPDGGYYLVGLKRVPRVPEIFAQVRWSGPHALEDTMANCTGLDVALIDTLADVDTGEDWRQWREGGCGLADDQASAHVEPESSSSS